MADSPNIDIPILRQLLSYNSETGKFAWLERPRGMFKSERAWRSHNRRFAGREALTAQSRGYFVGVIGYRHVYAHRVAYALHYGVWPDGEIDHINGDRSDNRIENLRAVAHSENMRNQRLRQTNASGVNGVDWDRRKGRWRAQITVRGKNTFVGYFSTVEAAATARRDAEIEQGFHPNHGRPR